MRQLGRTEKQRSNCEALAKVIDDFCEEKLGDLAKASMRLVLGRFGHSPFTGGGDLEVLRQRWFDLLPDRDKAKELHRINPFNCMCWHSR